MTVDIYCIPWAPHEVDAEIKISGHLDYLGHERNTSRGMDECDKEECLIKPTTTVGDWSSDPL